MKELFIFSFPPAQLNDDVVFIPNFPKSCTVFLWDQLNPHLFVALDKQACHTFVYVRQSIDGSFVIQFDVSTPLLSGQLPIMLHDSDLYVSSAGGKISIVKLATNFKLVLSGNTDENLLSCIRLRKYESAFELCKLLNNTQHWQQLGEALISDLDVAFGKYIRGTHISCNLM